MKTNVSLELEFCPVLDFSGGWGFNPPSSASQPPPQISSPRKLVKNSQKYIADPLWFYHKSSTGFINHFQDIKFCWKVRYK